MQLGYTLVYVPDVSAAVDFYERAFGLGRRFIYESGEYAEMETGATTLSFAANSMAAMNGLIVRHNVPDQAPAAIELCFVSDMPEHAFDRAIAAGAVALKPVEIKPWGQRVGYVQDLNGCLIELCSPVQG